MTKYPFEPAISLEAKYEDGRQLAKHRGATEQNTHNMSFNADDLAIAIGYYHALWEGEQQRYVEYLTDSMLQFIKTNSNYPPRNMWFRRCGASLPPPVFERIKACWLEQVSLAQGDSLVVGNAGWFIGAIDFEAGCELLYLAQKLEPTESLWSDYVARLAYSKFRRARAPENFKYATITCKSVEKILEIDGICIFLETARMAICAAYLNDEQTFEFCRATLLEYEEPYLNQFCSNLRASMALQAGDVGVAISEFQIVNEDYIWQESVAELAGRLLNLGYKTVVENVINQYSEFKIINQELRVLLLQDMENGLVDVEKSEKWLD